MYQSSFEFTNARTLQFIFFLNSLYDDVFLESHTALVISVNENVVAAGSVA